MQPTLELARSWSKLRLVPMLRDSPALRRLIGDPKSKKTGQEILEKQFPGGQLAIAGANAPGGLAGRPRRAVLGDEIDRWPLSAGTEGDPIGLASKRTSNFWNRIRGWISSPGNKGESRIWELWERSDQRRFWIPCPHCEEPQVLAWKNVSWPSEVDDETAAREAAYTCEHCGADWDDTERHEAVGRGTWRKGRPEVRTIAGFHLSALYSPWLSIRDLVLEWLQAQGNPEALKVFINTRLAELWRDAKLEIELDELVARREDYGPRVPEEVLAITCGVDVQGDRVEAEVVGWGKRGHSWSLEYHVIHGDPADLLDFDPKDPEADRRLDDVLAKRFVREDGAPMGIAATCVDSGGHHTDEVYRFAKRRKRRRVYAIKGKEGEGRLLWPKRASRSTRKNVGRVAVHILGVDAGKSALLHRLNVDDPSKPGYCHFPRRPEYDEEYFAQLTAEVPEPVRYVRGVRQPRRFKLVHPRNEALDVRVYASAALASLNPNFDRIEANLERAAEEARAHELEAPVDAGPELEPELEDADGQERDEDTPAPELEDAPAEAADASQSIADKMEAKAMRARRRQRGAGPRGRRR